MTSQIIRIQVPMESRLRDQLMKRAQSLGFDSIQALIRFLVKAQIDGRIVVFGDEKYAKPETSQNPPAQAMQQQADAERAYNDYRRQKLRAGVRQMLSNPR